MSGRLEGKVAIVTGASSGIGRAALERFAAEGARVVAVARSKDRLEEAREAVNAAGGECAIAPGDLSTQETADAVVQTAVDAFGGVDVLVNNAGVGYSYRQTRPKSMEPIADSPPDDWDHVMAINLGSVVHCIRAVLPVMREAGKGSIVNVASVLGFRGQPDAHAYTHGQGRHHQPHPLGRDHVREGGRALQRRVPGLHRDADGRRVHRHAQRRGLPLPVEPLRPDGQGQRDRERHPVPRLRRGVLLQRGAARRSTVG